MTLKGILCMEKITINSKAKSLCVWVAALIILIGAIAAFPLPAFAEGAEVYTLTATPYYAHPVTGAMEDSGQNPGIGQGMTESVLGKQALLEKNAPGDDLITVRFALMDNIENVEFSYQTDADSEYIPIPYTITQEDMAEGTADLCFPVPDETVIVRASFFVTAMGRDVIFFMTFSDPVAGFGDFITGAGAAAGLADTSEADAETTDAELTKDQGDTDGDDAGNDILAFIIIALLLVVVIALGGVLVYRKKAGASKQ
jgi:hypothetical protein